MYEYNCIIKRIVDGDTVDVNIDLGFDTWLMNQRIRIEGVNTPEIRTKDLDEKEAGYIAKNYVETLLPIDSKQVLICTEYNSTGKYGRIIGTFKVYDAINDRWCDLGFLLLEQGYAKPY